MGPRWALSLRHEDDLCGATRLPRRAGAPYSPLEGTVGRVGLEPTTDGL